MNSNLRILKKAIASVTVAAMSVSLLTSTASAYSGFSGDYTRSERLEQPKVSHEFAKNELGVVNFETTWGDKAANIASMDNYIKEADEKGTKILVFPEMAVTGYVSSSDPDSKEYKMAVSNAEELDGPTAKHFAKLADDDDMWIIYGATQKIAGDDEHAYNSAFVCSPDGEVTAYQKITPVEGSWCVAGDTPVIIDAGDYGKLGISICYDTYSTPELERYYSAMGCNILVNPTASGGNWAQSNMKGWEEYYKLRLESIASRDGFTIMSANLEGQDGDTLFPGGSIVMNAVFDGAKYYAGEETSDGSLTNDAKIVTNKGGLLTNTVGLTASTGTTCSNKDFNPEMYVDLYSQAAEAMAASGGAFSYSPKTTDGPKTAVVNMTGYWGNKKKTIAKMKEYIEEAHNKGVEMIVFPETVLSGYGYLTPDKDPFYQKYGVAMQVATAETIPGKSTNELSELAQEYDMYILFGMTEKDEKGPIYEANDTSDKAEKVYNAVAILYPDGKIDSYQKIHRAGVEDQWSVCGKTPKIIDTKWGKAGIDICMDGHFFPEIGRYYAAMGCTLFIHPTATGGNPWYRTTRIASYTDRDGMAAISSNLLGGDGIYTAPGDETYDPADTENNFDADGNFIGGSEIPEATNYDASNPYWDRNNWTYGTFASISFIATKGSTSDENPKPRVNYNGTGKASEGFAERNNTSPIGLEIADMNLTGTGFYASSQTFNPTLFSKLYDKLATLYRGGYSSKYGTDAVKDPVTVDLSQKDVQPSATPLATDSPQATASAAPTVAASATPTVKPSATPASTKTVKNPCTKVKAKKTKVTVKKGKKVTMKFTVTSKSKAKKTTDKMSVSVKNKKIATVTKKSLTKKTASVTLKGKKKGSTKVTLKIGKKTAKVTVKVK